MSLPQVGAEAVITNLPGFNRAIAKVNKGLKGAGKSATGFAKASNVAGKAVSAGLGAAATVATAGIAAVAAGAVAGTAAVVGLGVSSTKAAISIESAFAGVLKTTDGLGDSFDSLTDLGKEVLKGFRNLALEVPTDLEELMGIGELAGQLGIASDQLVDFTKTMAALGEATNLTGEEAAQAIAQIQNIFEVASGDMAENAERFGSSIVELGNNFATTERDILNFASRIAGAAKIAGISQDEILGIAAAFTSVGVEAEAGGTAVQKVLLNLNKAVLAGGEDLELFAQTAGLTAEEFADLFQKDAAQAFNLFVQGLGKAGDEAGFILDDLGLKDQRLTRAFLSLAQSGDLLTETLNSSSAAFAANTALTEEAEKRYKTVESQIQLLKNAFRDLQLEIGTELRQVLVGALEALNAFLRLKGLRNLLIGFAKTFRIFFNTLRFGEFGTVLMPELARAINFLGGSEGILESMGAAAEGFGAAINRLAVNIVQSGIIDKIANFIKRLFSFVSQIAQGGGLDALTILGFTPEVVATIRTVINTIKGMIKGLLGFIAGIGAGIAEGIGGTQLLGGKAKRGGKGGGLAAALGIDPKLVGTVSKFVGKIKDLILQLIDFVVNKAVPFLKKAFNSIVGFIKNLIGAIKTGDLGNILEALGFGDQAIENIQNFIGAVQRIFQAIAPILKAIFNIFAEVFKGIGGLIAGAFEGVDIDAQGGFEGFITFLENTAAAIEESGIAEFLEEIAVKIGDFFALLATGDPNQILQGLGFTPEAVAAILTFIELVKSTFEAFVAVIVEEVVPTLVEAWESFSAAFQIVVQVIKDLQPAWMAIWEANKIAVSIAIGIIIAIVIFLVAVITGIVNAIAEALAFMQQMWLEAADAIKLITEGKIIKGTLQLMWVGFKTYFGLIFKLVKGFVEGIIKFFTELKDKLIGNSIIPDMLKAIIKAFTVFGEEALVFIGELINNIISFIEDKVNDFIDLGIALMTGFLKGIESLFEKIIDSVGGFIDDLFNAAEETAGIFSPSKRAMKIGLQIDEGLALGMLQGLQLPVQAIQGVVDATLGQGISRQGQLVPALSPVQQGPSVTTISNSRTFAPTVQAQGSQPLNEDRIMNDLILLNMIDQG